MRNLLNVTARTVGQASRLRISSHDQSCTKRARLDTNSSSSSSQAIFALLGGRWAAQVYVIDRWIMIGIFDSEKEAVRAYERTSMKLWIEILTGNLPSASTQETNIQKQASVEAAIVEINDDGRSSASCKALQVNGNQKCDVLAVRNTHRQVNIEAANARNNDDTNSSSLFNALRMHWNQNFECTRLFEKVLTQSDTGSCNRFLVPRIHASYFPSITSDDDAELSFYDRSMTLWTFRYCYWTTSRSRVFSKGWCRFVREKHLSTKDKLVFYKCKHLEATDVVHTYFMIDVEYHDNGVEEVRANVRVGEESNYTNTVQVLSDGNDKDDGVKTSSVERDMTTKAVEHLEEGDESEKTPATGFKLFGVTIA